MIKKCEHCGKKFEAKRSTAKYCGGTCRKAAFDARQVSVTSVTNAKSSGEIDAQELAVSVANIVAERLQADAPGSGMGGGGDVMTALETLFNQMQQVQADIKELSQQPRTAVPAPSRVIQKEDGAQSFDVNTDDILNDIGTINIEVSEAETTGKTLENFLGLLKAVECRTDHKEIKQ